MAPSSEVNGSQVVMEVPYCEQDWYFLAVSSNSSGTWYQINDQHGKCLDADLNHINSLGDKVQVWDCNGSAQQHWYAPNGNNTELINGANTNFVLDARTDGTWNPSMNGDPLQLYSPNGSPQQTWYELH
ncbi:RICIN domain-containing protein [Actinoallomurus sp. NPDC050550]|uniref:RICIN domain-containing protein n=1 Tax=Actinoallomurus sp. NPDC050550 TaxID=3154937 RepID=UPI0033FB62C8